MLHAILINMETDMRVYLTTAELTNPAAADLLSLCIRISIDGKIELEEIKELRRWLRNYEGKGIPAVTYLADIMQRITADKVIDQDELVELQMAIERVVPAVYRTPIVQARRKRDQEKQARRRELRQIQLQHEKESQDRQKSEAIAKAMRLRHDFAKVAGVTFQNDDWTERQDIIAKCRVGETLYFQHDVHNKYSTFATKVLRQNNEQIGHVPEYLAGHVLDQIDSGYGVIGFLSNITGGYGDHPVYGVNILIVYFAKDVSNEEFTSYVKLQLHRL